MSIIRKVINYVQVQVRRAWVNLGILRMANRISAHSHPNPNIHPVVFFNASTRLVGMSLNAAFSLLTSWALRIKGVPVAHFVCQAGMSRCVLGTDRDDFSKSPPCKKCISQSRWLFTGALAVPFTYLEDIRLYTALRGLSIAQLEEFEYPLADKPQSTDNPPSPLPVGHLVLPSIRWVLRRHHLTDDESTRFLYRQYILSAYRVAQEFSAFLDQTAPQAVILFNGMFFPEATARWVAIQRGIRAIAHEVGLQPMCAFFTSGEATAYPLHVPESFELTEKQNVRLDEYLSQRFRGQFSMAGIKFWPEIKGLDQAFLTRAASFKQIVPIFTNVIFDTSQPHSNVVFPHMFAWLDLVLEIIRNHPETLFVIRAHPDESRPGKASQESVRQWVAENQAEALPNLIFIDSHQPLSSYELIQRSKFVMVYNSTIGLEASILGSAVLCAGRARFTQLPTVFFPRTLQDFTQQAESLLEAAEIIVPAQFRRNARRFLYYQLFYSSLPFGNLIKPDRMPGFVRLRKFPIRQLTPQASPTIKILLDGILEDKAFLLENQ
jgi:hypothetical protein